MGWDITDLTTLQELEQAREPFIAKTWLAQPLTAAGEGTTTRRGVINPADAEDIVGEVFDADFETVTASIQHAVNGFADWSGSTVGSRAECLRRMRRPV